MTASFMVPLAALKGCATQRYSVKALLRSTFYVSVSSLIVLEEVFERFADFLCLSLEQMVRAVDDREFSGLLEPRVECPQARERADLVVLALHEEFRLPARQRPLERVLVARQRRRHRRRDADQHRHAVVVSANLERDPRAERESGGPELHPWISRRHVVERTPEIIFQNRRGPLHPDWRPPLRRRFVAGSIPAAFLSVAEIECAGAPADAAEVEPQNGAPDPHQPLRSLKHRF